MSRPRPPPGPLSCAVRFLQSAGTAGSLRRRSERTVHAYSIVSSLLDRVESVALAHGASGVHGVRVRIGDLAGVDRSLFRTAFETFRAGSMCADAALTIV